MGKINVPDRAVVVVVVTLAAGEAGGAAEDAALAHHDSCRNVYRPLGGLRV